MTYLAEKKMKNIYLFYTSNNPLIPHFPESVLYLAAALRDNGFQSTIFDPDILPESELNIIDPLFIGISIYTNESILKGLKYARKIRNSFPDTLIVWGGPHAQLAPEETARHTLVDVVCYDEGEKVVVDIAKQLSNKYWNPSIIGGIIYKKNNQIIRNPPNKLLDADEIPFPDYSALKKSVYFISQNKIYYQSSRGCPFQCSFCSYKHGRKWRGKSFEKVLSEIDRIISEFNPSEIYFSDANFFVDLKRAKRICMGIIEKEYHFKWSAFCRVDTIQKMSADFLKLLKKSGCYKLDIGGESGADEVLEKYNKGITRKMIIDSVKKISNENIIPELSFIIGVPFETSQNIKETLSLIETLEKEYTLTSINGYFQYQPYPNTPLGERIIKEWQLPIPKSLEEWAQNPITIPRREYFPWLSRKQYNTMMMYTSIVSYKFLYNKLINSAESQILCKKKFRFRILFFAAVLFHHSLIKLSIFIRLKMGVDMFPFEWKLYRRIRDKLLKMI